MKRYLLLIVLLSGICFASAARNSVKSEKKKSAVCLTVQAENGSVKQQTNEDGTITCVINKSDLIRITAILLNGEDVTCLLDNTKLNLPQLTKNATLEVQFEEYPTFCRQEYKTIAMF
jgi:hypothetical protein